MSTLTKKIKPRGFYIFTIISVITIGLYLLLNPSTSGLKSTIEDQLHALQIEDIATAYSYTSTAFQKSASFETFKRFVRDYSGLRNNESIVFNKSSIKNGIGKVKATLTSRGGKETGVTYELVKEHHRWKIESIVLAPGSDDHPVSTSEATPAPTTATNNANSESAPAVTEDKPLPPQVYEDDRNNYSLTYPANWEYAKADNDILVFHKKDMPADDEASLSIQPVKSEYEGARLSVQQMIDTGEESIKAKAGGYKIVEDGLLPPGANKNENFHGRYVVYSYTLDNNKSYKQLQVIYFKSPSRAQYIIDFTSPEAQFDADLPSVRAMIASFRVG